LRPKLGAGRSGAGRGRGVEFRSEFVGRPTRGSGLRHDEKVVKKILEHLADLVEPSREGKFLRYPSWLLSGTAPILLKGPLLLILCRDARRSRGVGGAAVPFAHIAYCRERASPTATGGCESRLQRKRMMFTGSQRLTIALLTRCTASWRTTVTLVQPATVLRWHWEGFRLLWRWRSRPRGRRPTRYATLIREMAARIQGGAPSGFEVSCSSLESGSRNAPCSGT